MRALRLLAASGGMAAMLGASATVMVAQEYSHRGPPSIRIYSANGVDVINTSSYVTPEIELSENAYVFSVAMDLDGQIQVLSPDFPGISVKISAHKQLHLPNFFAGFNRSTYEDVYETSRFQHYTNSGGWGDTRGVAIALASRAPFSLERIERGGDWDMVALRHLLENRTPQEAMFALASYIGAEGEPIGRDYMRFAGANSGAYAYNDYPYFSSPCDLYNGYYYAPGRGLASLSEVNRTGSRRVAGKQPRIVGYDFCGVPIISYGPVIQGRYPKPGQPRSTGDTTVFPKSRTPRGTPRHPSQASALAAPEGVFPVAHRANLPQLGDVTITAPRGRRAEPGQILNGYGSQPTALAAPQGRMPLDRTFTGSGASGASGGQPLREYHPEPRVESPPPSRAPEPRATPAPVVHEHPAPPPPRVEPTTTTTRTEPLRAPPQNRK